MDLKICIVGKSNVGKSTLFNLLIKKKKSIINKEVNTTKNRNYGNFKIKNKIYYLIDTGGYYEEKNKNNVLKKKVIEQIIYGIKESYLILYVVDVVEGITYLDKKLSLIIRKYNKPTFLLINKIDIKKYNYKNNYYEYYKLGYYKIYPISCSHNIGIKKLYNDIYKYFIKEKNNKYNNKYNNKLKISVVGKPNTGKSTFINNYLKDYTKSIVSNIEGTTIDTLYFYNINKNKNFIIIDTPGIIKKFKFSKKIQNEYLLNTIKVIKESDICILIIDNKITNNDIYIYNKILLYKKGLLILFNKIDLFNKKERKEIILTIKKIIKNNYPYLLISNKNKLNDNTIKKINNIINKIYKNRKKKINSSILNNKLLLKINKKIKIKNKILKIKFCYQLKNKQFPSFVLISNLEKRINLNFKKYIENIIIKLFDFYGVPIEISFKKNKKNVNRYINKRK
ncbi:ribosome biogenesis GTPase Der [Candidatus Shikimatogenerans bostrichidophilus]|uniref:ribosome biogenesis GTPase Der n=1 Tax=Candidatus Shikimatogenerans bostrichidophilus TaxID=2943807 RepID=UPI00296620C3